MDQRGTPRPRGPRADIGAFEAEHLPVLNISCSDTNTLIWFDPEIGRTYRLLSSTDLTHWTPAGASNVLSPGPILFLKPVKTNGFHFYRIVTP